MAPRARRLVLMLILVVAGAFAWTLYGTGTWRHPMAAPPIVVRAAYQEFADTLGQRETLSDVLARAGVTGRTYTAFLAAATGLDVRRLRPGLVWHFRRLATDSLVDQVMVRPDADRRLWYTRDADGWREHEVRIPWTATRVRIQGTIVTSLYDALDAAVPDSTLPPPERQALAWAIADVYDWEVDFTRDVRAGDRFEVLFERLEAPDGARRVGRVLAARVDVARTPSYAFFFATDTAADHGGFYDEQGRSLKRAFLRAPLQFRRISSRFGNRYHPILHRYRNHDGIDYAADYGTPVRATADGIVTRAGRDGGYGNLVELRHANGIRTRYGHLSRFARGLRIGQRITQGQTIGYVGATGLATGPHLHYEFLVGGRATNPLRTSAGVGKPVPPSLRAAFETQRQRLQNALEPALIPIGAANVD
jgi:murein DD-endopeptidase MepM/ murein hydrolase activator NlpD